MNRKLWRINKSEKESLETIERGNTRGQEVMIENTDTTRDHPGTKADQDRIPTEETDIGTIGVTEIDQKIETTGEGPDLGTIEINMMIKIRKITREEAGKKRNKVVTNMITSRLKGLKISNKEPLRTMVPRKDQ